MQTVAEPVVHDADQAREWMVELNIAGCRILRWAQKRRHLLGIDRHSRAA